jgi:prepilin-type N-terminal cleavage/methylation domain-containing protein
MQRQSINSQHGFSLIELLIVVAIIGIIAALAIPNLLAARRAANEASAISAIRTLSSVEETYRTTKGNGSQFTDMAGLLNAQLIDSQLAAATTVATSKSGYVFSIVMTTGNVNFCAGAAPVTVNTGTRNFSSDEPGVIYVHALSVSNPPTTTSGGTALTN